jgi:small subunit ribosomal protein S6
MKAKYECLFIIASDVKDDARAALVEKFSKMAGAGAKVEPWGLKKFASIINHKKEGYYYLMNFSASPEVPAAIGNLMNITEGMVRYLFVNKDEQKAIKVKKAKKAEAKSE